MKPYLPYPLLSIQEIKQQMNTLAALHHPFLFIIDYRMTGGYVVENEDFDENYLKFEFEDFKSSTYETTKLKKDNPLIWNVSPITIEQYKLKFDFVIDQIHKGNSFLTNLTQPTAIQTNFNLQDLYVQGKSRYKLWLKDHFVFFSPETFIKIENNTISSFPMKGTIDAAVPNAQQLILNDSKEMAEHATIVDLIRNDLSLVAQKVNVKRYRYVEKLTTNKKDLLQVSSEITGELDLNFKNKFGDLIVELLPAGSISGAPKKKTIDIIEKAETYDRGFYTGVCGYFDGTTLNSAVMIRFIEQQDDKLVFKSGGGITAQSDLKKEYEELIQKVYVPVS